MKTIWLGAMNFGTRVSDAESKSIIGHAIERGITHFDTSNSYGDGTSERIVGDAMGKAVDVTLATKVGMGKSRGKSEGLSPKTIVASVEASRKRLRRETIDVLYLHAPDPETPIEQTIGAIVKLIDERKIRRWGVSNYAAWQVAEILLFCAAQQVPRPAISQVLYNVLVRQIELEYMPFAKARALETVVYNPLAGGLLSGKYSHDDPPTSASRFAKNKLYQRRYWSRPMFGRAAALEEVARDAGRSLLSLAYGFVAANDGVSGVLVGPSAAAHVDAAILAMSEPLNASILKKIDEIEMAMSGTDARYAR